MSTADDRRSSDEQGQPTGRPTEAGRRRGRKLLPAIIVGVVAFLVAFMVLVSQCGRSEDDLSGTGPGPAVVTVDNGPAVTGG